MSYSHKEKGRARKEISFADIISLEDPYKKVLVTHCEKQVKGLQESFKIFITGNNCITLRAKNSNVKSEWIEALSYAIKGNSMPPEIPNPKKKISLMLTPALDEARITLKRRSSL